MGQEQLEKGFQDPPKIYSPVPIWWWSGERLVKERLRWQMERLVEGGVFNVLILNLAPDGPLFGSDPDDPPFLSEEWWDYFLFVLKEAERLGMFVWFYDQLGFSGARLQDKLLFDHPEFRGAAVRWIETTIRGGTSVELTLPEHGIPLAVHALTKGGESRCLKVFRKGEKGPFRWHAPKGRWRLLFFYAVPFKFDYLNPKACQALLRKVHGEFERRARRYLGKVLVGSFQDELPMLPTWTWHFPREFRRRKGYEVCEWLPALFFPTGNDEALRVRCDVRDVLTALAEEAFFRPFFEWHEKHGLLCAYDQCNRNADPIGGQRWYLDYWRTMRWYSVPGQDHSGDALPHAALAACYRRRRIWLEGFHSSGWGHTLDELSQWLHRWYLRGANLYNPHAVYYTTKGSWWEWAPPSTCWRQPYWHHYRSFSDHITRLSFLLSRGNPICPIALLYPSTTVHAHMGLGHPDKVAQRCRQIYWALVGNPHWWRPRLGLLERGGWGFTLIDEETLQRAPLRKGTLSVGDNAIRVILLPGVDVLHEGSFKRLQAFARSGGFVIAVGSVPSFVLGWDKIRTSRAVKTLFGLAPGVDMSPYAEVPFPSGGRGIFVRDPQKVPSLLNRLLPRTVEGIFYRHWRADDEDFFFVVHPAVIKAPRPVEGVVIKPRTITAKFTLEGFPHLWDTTTGEISPCPFRREKGKVIVALDFSKASGLVLSFRPGRQALSVPPKRQERVIATIDGLFDVYYRPTLDNRWGDFDSPPYKGPLPLQVRQFRHREEGETEDGLTLGWHRPESDDKNWETLTYSFGTYLLFRGPFRPEEAPPPRVKGTEPGWRPFRLSLKLGIENDPIHRGTLGPKGHVPEEFIDLGDGKEGEQFDLFTTVTAEKEGRWWLCLGGIGGKEVWLNGEKVLDMTDADLVCLPVHLKEGDNPLLLRLTRRVGRLRAFFHFLPSPRKDLLPRWIWFPELPYPDQSVPQCRRTFRRWLTLPHPVRSAWLGIIAETGYQVWVNGEKVGEGRINRAKIALDRYPLTDRLKEGRNLIAVEAWTEGGPAGLLIYGELELQDGTRGVFVSNGAWKAGRWAPGQEPPQRLLYDYDDGWWEWARSYGFPPMAPWGQVIGLPDEVARAPHPLPRAGWLDGKPDRPFNPSFEPFPQKTKRISWFRFPIPPGAEKMHLKVKGKVRVFVDGQEVLPEEEGSYPLPGPQKERRLGVLRVETEVGYPQAGAILEPVTFTVGKGRMGLGAWSDWGLSCYAGGIVYEKTFPLPPTDKGTFILDLGKVQGTAEVWLNGKRVGVRVWAPYRFPIPEGLLQEGENRLRIIVYSSLGPHFSEAIPTPYVFGAQRLAGLFGPVRLLWTRKMP